MKRFEYMRVVVEAGADLKICRRDSGSITVKCPYLYFNEQLGVWGMEGWELVSHSDHDSTEVHMFKRELDPISPTAPTLEI